MAANQHVGPSLPVRLRVPILPRMQTAVTLTLNGEARAFDGPMTVAALLATLGLETRKVAVERNAEIVPRSATPGPGSRAAMRWRSCISSGEAEMDATLPQDDTWTVAGRRFSSRLIVGTGRYKDLEETGAAIAAPAPRSLRLRCGG